MNEAFSLGSPAASATGLDAAALDRLRQLDPGGRLGVVRRVLAAYETSLVRMLAQLEAARSSADAAAVAAIAHTLKSSSASVGALGLAAACADVEARLRGAGQPAGGPPRPGAAAPPPAPPPAPVAAGLPLNADIARLIDEGASALASVRAMLQT
jgi:hypothetical protein